MKKNKKKMSPTSKSSIITFNFVVINKSINNWYIIMIKFISIVERKNVLFFLFCLHVAHLQNSLCLLFI